MQAAILAAGRGTRMGPLAESRPKPMLPVADRPMIEHVMDAAARAGVDAFVVVVGYRGDTVRQRLGETFEGIPIRYAQQSDQVGTAHALGAASDRLDGPFMVLNGDNVYDAEGLARLREAGPSVATYRVDDPSNYGVLSTEDGSVTGVFEKPASPPSDQVNAGAYVFPETATDWLSVPMSDRGEHELTDVLAIAAEERDVTPVELDDWMDVGRPWELLEATDWRLRNVDRRIEGDVSESAHLDGTVIVESGATIREGTVVEGPVLVRAGATVGPNAYVRGSTVVGEDAAVGHAVEVKNSVLLREATIGHRSYIGDSVLGSDVALGAGTTVANLRHDDEPVSVTVKGDRVSTGRRKFGVVVGDGASTGIDTSLNAGVTLSRGVRTAPGEVLTRDR